MYIADTYNNKIKVYDPATGMLSVVAGTGKPADGDDPAAFDEPGGLSVAGPNLYVADTNNHAIRVVDLKSGKTRTLKLSGVKAPKPPARPPIFPKATVLNGPPVKVAPGGTLTFDVSIALPAETKINLEAPMPYLVETPGKNRSPRRERIADRRSRRTAERSRETHRADRQRRSRKARLSA